MKKSQVFVGIFGALIALNSTWLMAEDISAKSDLSILDSNRDGVINPYEALDALLFYRDYKGDDLTISSLAKLGSKANTDVEEELESIFASVDKNGDGKASWDELDSDRETQGMGPHLDTNGDKALSFDEFVGIYSTEMMIDTPEQIAENIEELFAEMDANKDGYIDIELEVEDGPSKVDYLEMDLNRDRKLTKDEALLFNQKMNRVADFRVDG